MLFRFLGPSARARLGFVHDCIMAAAALLLAFYLRLGDEWLTHSPPTVLIAAVAAFTGVAAVAFLINRLNQGMWRYASIDDMLAIVRSATITVLIFTAVMFLWTRLEDMPRSVPVISWLTLMFLLASPRLFYRLLKDRRLDLHRKDRAGEVPVLLVGAGAGAELFIRALQREPQRPFRVVGILSANRKRSGHRIHGTPVLGAPEDLAAVRPRLARKDRPQKLILTGESEDGTAIRKLLDDATQLGMTLARLPRLTEFRNVDATTVQQLSVADLLGRPQVPFDRETAQTMVRRRRVLITGAGGSIGSELVRQIAALGPAELTLVDSSEANLYEIELETRENHPALTLSPTLADVRDRDRIARLFSDARPELVFHAAALKHVAIVETNPLEGIATNVLGTLNVMDACAEAGADTMVLISTDKAVNPASVMGATKRLAELCCVSRSAREETGTRFLSVRFGNVLGSSGSVVPLFDRQIADGGPVTVTDPEMQRYFMTVGEAVTLVLQASGLRRRGGIFVLNMGQPVKIVDLAKQMIRLAGLRPGADVDIVFRGARTGEKLVEEPFYENEEPAATECPDILLVSPRAGDDAEIDRGIEALAEAILISDRTAAMEALRRLVPEYRPLPCGR